MRKRRFGGGISSKFVFGVSVKEFEARSFFHHKDFVPKEDGKKEIYFSQPHLSSQGLLKSGRKGTLLPYENRYWVEMSGNRKRVTTHKVHKTGIREYSYEYLCVDVV